VKRLGDLGSKMVARLSPGGLRALGGSLAPIGGGTAVAVWVARGQGANLPEWPMFTGLAVLALGLLFLVVTIPIIPGSKKAAPRGEGQGTSARDSLLDKLRPVPKDEVAEVIAEAERIRSQKEPREEGP
jgi:hypothetical protein